MTWSGVKDRTATYLAMQAAARNCSQGWGWEPPTLHFPKRSARQTVLGRPLRYDDAYIAVKQLRASPNGRHAQDALVLCCLGRL
eukprot:4802221-Alexandrium_andersonii.AAC.1